MGGETAAFICIVIFAFFSCMGGMSIVALWYLKQSIKEVFQYLTEDIEVPDEEEPEDNSSLFR